LNGCTITFDVEDIDAFVAQLAVNGVCVLGRVADNPWGRTVAFTDPDGNVIKVMEPVANQ
jgi:predicted enzyme related to lactoylglutathione lyase